MIQERSHQYKPIAQLKQAHGVYGAIEVTGNSEIASIFSKYNLFWIIDEHDMMVPLRLDSFKQAGGHPDTFFVQFDDVTTRSKAASLSGSTLYLEQSDDHKPDNDIETIDEGIYMIMDYEIFDQDNNCQGFVIDVMENPAHPILISDTDLMIPYVSEYINSVDSEKKIIYCKNLTLLKDI